MKYDSVTNGISDALSGKFGDINGDGVVSATDEK